MIAPDTRLRKAIADALAGHAEAQALFGHPLRLMERADRHSLYPYLSWGRAQLTDKSANGVDLVEARLDLQVWVREGDARALVGALRSILRRLDITPPVPWSLISLMPVYSDAFSTHRPGTRRGLIRLRALMAQDEETWT